MEMMKCYSLDALLAVDIISSKQSFNETFILSVKKKRNSDEAGPLTLSDASPSTSMKRQSNSLTHFVFL